jgi:hypothetical protein
MEFSRKEKAPGVNLRGQIEFLLKIDFSNLSLNRQKSMAKFSPFYVNQTRGPLSKPLKLLGIDMPEFTGKSPVGTTRQPPTLILNGERLRQFRRPRD